jgi:hypothetical protein
MALMPSRESKEHLEKAALSVRDGEAVSYESISEYSTGDLGYNVEVERTRAKFGGTDEMTPVSLTTIFRREDGEWDRPSSRRSNNGSEASRVPRGAVLNQRRMHARQVPSSKLVLYLPLLPLRPCWEGLEGVAGRPSL